MIELSHSFYDSNFILSGGLKMSRICYICEKGTVSGGSVKRRGMAKKKGGVGRRITGSSKRVFKPNLKKIKIIVSGKTKQALVCAKCIKAGKVQKAL